MFAISLRESLALIVLALALVLAGEEGLASAIDSFRGFAGALPEVWWKITVPPGWDRVPFSAPPARMISPILTALLCLHVFGVVLGLGGALFLDFYLLRHLYVRPLTPQTIDITHYGTSFVTVGLAALWISGLGFMLIYGMQAPANLSNPKLWVKLAVVCVLSANGYFIHRAIVPRLSMNMGTPLLAGEPLARALPFLVPAAVSSLSWIFAFALGMVRELNFIASAQTLSVLYGLALCAALAGVIVAHLVALRFFPQPVPVSMRTFAGVAAAREVSEPKSASGAQLVQQEVLAAAREAMNASNARSRRSNPRPHPRCRLVPSLKESLRLRLSCRRRRAHGRTSRSHPNIFWPRRLPADRSRRQMKRRAGSKPARDHRRHRPTSSPFSGRETTYRVRTRARCLGVANGATCDRRKRTPPSRGQPEASREPESPSGGQPHAKANSGIGFNAV